MAHALVMESTCDYCGDKLHLSGYPPKGLWVACHNMACARYAKQYQVPRIKLEERT